MSVEEQVKEGVVLDLNIQHHGTDAITRQMTKDLYAQLDTFRIYSLSKRCDNLSMWAKYAEEHSGYCLEFANSGPFFGSAKAVAKQRSPELKVSIAYYDSFEQALAFR